MKPFTYARRALLFALTAIFVAGCGSDDGEADQAKLQLSGAIDRPAIVTQGQLQASFPLVGQTLSFVSGSNNAVQTHTYVGADLWTFLNSAGIQLDASRKNDILNRYVLATAPDGYKVVYALGELHPEYGNRQALVAYAETINGVTSSIPEGDGPLRTTAPGDVRGSRYVSNLTRLDVRTSGSSIAGSGGGESARLVVNGAVAKTATYDVATLKSLPANTLTVGANTYTGVNLWTLLNTVIGLQVDSASKNPTLGMYTVATGTDGYKALISIGEIHPNSGNKAALVAYAVNGGDLGASGAIRLVMPGDVRQGRTVSNLSSIEVFTAAAP